MFNNKKIEELEASIKNLPNKISELQTQFDQILDKLDNKNFSKDWEEYLKWKEMKDQLPEIEEMYNLKELKRLISKRDQHDKAYNLYLLEYSKFNHLDQSFAVNRQARKNALEMTNLFQNKVLATEKKIQEYLETIGKLKNKKELIGILKLYGISTDWVKP